MAIGKILQGLLKDMNIKVNDFAYKIDVSPQTIYSLIQRDKNHIDIELLYKIVNELNVPISYFIGQELKEKYYNHKLRNRSIDSNKISNSSLSSRLFNSLEEKYISINTLINVHNIPSISIQNFKNDYIGDADIIPLIEIAALCNEEIEWLITGMSEKELNQMRPFEAPLSTGYVFSPGILAEQPAIYECTYNTNTIGERLYLFRKYYDVSLEEVVRYSGLQLHQIEAIERGEMYPPFNYIFIFTISFNVSIDYILFGSLKSNTITKILGIRKHQTKSFYEFIGTYSRLSESRQNDISEIAKLWQEENHING